MTPRHLFTSHYPLSGSSRGFTLVEVLVALTILTVGLIPAFQQATTAISLSGSIRNSLIASNLAQEGLEVVRAIRDANWFADQPFNQGLDGGTPGFDYIYLVQYDSRAPIPIGSNPPLKFDSASGLYQYTTGTDTIFHRAIYAQPDPTGASMKIVSQVSWIEKGISKIYSVEYYLYDWLQ